MVEINPKITKFKFDGKLFAKAMKAKRVIDSQSNISISIRSAAKITKVSFSTMSRLEKGGKPEINTFFAICKWLDKPMEYFFVKSK